MEVDAESIEGAREEAPRLSQKRLQHGWLVNVDEDSLLEIDAYTKKAACSLKSGDMGLSIAAGARRQGRQTAVKLGECSDAARPGHLELSDDDQWHYIGCRPLAERKAA